MKKSTGGIKDAMGRIFEAFHEELYTATINLDHDTANYIIGVMANMLGVSCKDVMELASKDIARMIDERHDDPVAFDKALTDDTSRIKGRHNAN